MKLMARKTQLFRAVGDFGDRRCADVAVHEKGFNINAKAYEVCSAYPRTCDDWAWRMA